MVLPRQACDRSAMLNPTHKMRGVWCRSAQLPCLLFVLAVPISAAPPRPCGLGSAQGCPPAAAPLAAFANPNASAACFAAPPSAASTALPEDHQGKEAYPGGATGPGRAEDAHVHRPSPRLRHHDPYHPAPRRALQDITTSDRVAAGQQPQQQEQQPQQQGSWLDAPWLLLSWFEQLPWGRMLLIKIITDSTKRLELRWPVQTAAVAQGWALVQHALHPLVADCLAYAVFTLAWWPCLPNPGHVSSLVPQLVGTALVQVVVLWQRYVVGKDCPHRLRTYARFFLSIHMTRWSWMSAGLYLIVCLVKIVVCLVKSVVRAVSSVLRVAWQLTCLLSSYKEDIAHVVLELIVVYAAWRMVAWGLRLWERRQRVHTTTITQQQQEQQEQHGSVSSWLQLPFLPVLWLLNVVKQFHARTLLLALVIPYGMLPIEKQWPDGGAAAAQWWAQVQLALHPLVANCLGNGIVTTAFWFCLPPKEWVRSPLLQLLVGTVLAQVALQWCVYSGTCPRPQLLSSYLQYWAIVTQGVYVFSLCVPSVGSCGPQPSPAPQQQPRHGSSNSISTRILVPRCNHHQQQQHQQSAVPVAEPASSILTHPHNSSSSSSTSSSTCRGCGVARGPKVKLFKCSKCGGSADRYCSVACFKKDWPRHKLVCK